MYDLVETLIKIQNVLEWRGEKIVFPNAVVATHSYLPGEQGYFGLWWYNLRTKSLLYSKTAETHIDKEFREKIPELAIRIPNKLLANKAGWISGRVGEYQGKIFAFIYSNEFDGYLPGSVAADIIQQLENLSELNIEYLIDEDGHSLLKEE